MNLMPAVDLVVLGSAGHAREVMDIAGSQGCHRLLGCVGPGGPDERLPVPWLGGDDWLTTAPIIVVEVTAFNDRHAERREKSW